MKINIINLRQLFCYGLVTLFLLADGVVNMVQAKENNDDWNYFVAGYLTAASIDAKTTSILPLVIKN